MGPQVHLRQEAREEAEVSLAGSRAHHRRSAKRALARATSALLKIDRGRSCAARHKRVDAAVRALHDAETHAAEAHDASLKPRLRKLERLIDAAHERFSAQCAGG